MTTRPMDLVPADAPEMREFREAMRVMFGEGQVDLGADPLDQHVARILTMARYMLERDGFHVPMAHLFDGKGAPAGAGIVVLAYEDPARKYLTQQLLADEVARCGARAVILITEAWTAPMPEDFDPEKPSRRPRDHPDRGQALIVTVATWDGRSRTYTSPFTIDDAGCVTLLGEAQASDTARMLSLAPVQQVWARWRTPGE